MTVEQITDNAKKLVEIQSYIKGLKAQLPKITGGHEGFYPNGFNFDSKKDFDKITEFVKQLAEEKIAKEEIKLHQIIADMGFPEVCL